MLKQSLVRDGIVLKWVLNKIFFNLFMATRNVQKWYTWSCPSKKWEDGHLLISFVAMCVIRRHGMGTEYTTSGCGRRPYHWKCADFQTSWFLFCGQNLAGTQTRCGIGIPKTSQVRIWSPWHVWDLVWSPCAVTWSVDSFVSRELDQCIKSGRSEPRKQHINELQHKALARPLMMEAKYGIMA